MTLQLDENGLQIQTQEEILDGLSVRQRAVLGRPNFKAKDAKSKAGQLNNGMAELNAIAQQALLDVYASFDPASATGRTLDARVGLTGTVRKGATYSYVNGVLTFASAGTAPQGMLIKAEDDETLWELTDGPHTSAGPWPEEIAAQFTAQTAGPIAAVAGTTWNTVTVVTGLTGFTNPADDANIGRLRETDAELRKRRDEEKHAQGQGPLLAIQGVVSKVDGVIYCRVYHNPSVSPVDSNGIPFKAINVVVETQPSIPTAALQEAIWEAIWSALGGGGQAFGTDYEGLIVDSEGMNQTIGFDTITNVPIAIEVDLISAGTENPITPNLRAVVAAKVLAMANAELAKHGRDVGRADIRGIVSAMLTAGTISGPYDVEVRLSRDAEPLADVARIEVGIREKPEFNSADITVLLDGVA